MWIFGYGSLVWKVDFPYEEKVVGYIKGYIRRFWQASIDHRGVPDKPGRVVTLVKSDDPQSTVWGCAYKINESLVKEGGQLSQREQKYTERKSIKVITKDGQELNALVFVGTNDPQLQLGPAPLYDMAVQISNAEGPSGHNSEYLFRLASFLRQETVAHEETEDIVWGVAYKFSDEKQVSILNQLDYREKGGYQRMEVLFYPMDSENTPWKLLIYVGTVDNPFFTGPTNDDAIADIIATSTGPSGSNKEYLFSLVSEMNKIGVIDCHLQSLYEKVLKCSSFGVT